MNVTYMWTVFAHQQLLTLRECLTLARVNRHIQRELQSHRLNCGTTTLYYPRVIEMQSAGWSFSPSKH